jgi:hypothetical protein
MAGKELILTNQSLDDLEEIPQYLCFQNIGGLRKSKVKLGYSQHQIDEIRKCSEDPKYFIRNYIKIIHPDRGEVLFDLYDFQDDLVGKLHNNRFVISKIARQSGKTSTHCAYLTHYILFNRNKTVGIVANKGQMAIDIMEMIRQMYLNLPFWMQQGIKRWAKRSIVLENGSKVVCQATSGSALRGLTINILYWDECAFVPKNIADDFLASVFPTISVSKVSKIFLSSTPSGYNHFAKFWFDAENGINGFVPFKAFWYNVPGRDEEWKKKTIAKIGQRMFDQEYDCKFLGSAGTLLDSKSLENLFHKTAIQTHYNHDMKIYEMPKKDHVYVLCADSSEGKEQNYHAFSIIDVTEQPYQQVATYRNNKISYLIYPDVILFAANMYGPEICLVIENNSIGHTIIDTLIYDLEADVITFNSNLKELGLRTTTRTKRMGATTLKTLMEDNKLLIFDFDTIDELFNFILVGKTYKANEGHTDDLVMGLVFFAYMTTTTFFKEFALSGHGLRKKLYEDRANELKEMEPPEIIICGQPGSYD